MLTYHQPGAPSKEEGQVLRHDALADTKGQKGQTHKVEAQQAAQGTSMPSYGPFAPPGRRPLFCCVPVLHAGYM